MLSVTISPDVGNVNAQIAEQMPLDSTDETVRLDVSGLDDDTEYTITATPASWCYAQYRQGATQKHSLPGYPITYSAKGRYLKGGSAVCSACPDELFNSTNSAMVVLAYSL